jgi:hypothetical protein
MMKRLIVPALLLACAVGTAKGGGIGTQGFVDMGTPVTNTGDINTASVFSTGDLVTTTAQTGIFVGMAEQEFGSTSFSLTKSGSFLIRSSEFGTFASTSITEVVNTPGIVGIYILGKYTPGAIEPGAPTTLAGFTLSFTQTPAHTGSISDSGTISVPPPTGPTPQAVPEPATLVMGLTSIVGGGLFHFLRRRAKKGNA